MVSQLLTEIDGLEDLKGVTIIGATNRPDIIDEALLRPGRFDRIIEIPLPDKNARRHILSIHTRKKPLDSTCDLDRVTELTEGYTGADLEALVNAAAIAAIKDRISLLKNSEGTDLNSTENKDHNNKKKIADSVTSKLNGLKLEMRHFEDALQKIKKKEALHSIVK